MTNMKVFKFKGQTYEIKDGKSMYDIVVENGFKGTKVDFIKDLFQVKKLKAKVKK